MRPRSWSFWAALVVSLAGCHLLAYRLLPSDWRLERPARDGNDGNYLAHCAGVGIDYYVLRFGLFGTGESVRNADVLCVSNSKGLYGYDAHLLSERLSCPDRPVRVYNLSFGFGEGITYVMEVVKRLDLRDKVLVADLAIQMYSDRMTPMGRTALETNSTVGAYLVCGESWLMHETEWLAQGLVPRIVFTRDRGFAVKPYISTSMRRDRATGDWPTGTAATPHWPCRTRYNVAFQLEALREPFLEECRRRNLRLVFISIPCEDGYDPEWGERTARELGYPYLRIDPDGIELFDGAHMSAKGRAVFSERLAEQLRASHFGTTAPALLPEAPAVLALHRNRVPPGAP